MTNVNQFYDGPSASFAAGDWVFVASVCVDAIGIGGGITAKLWDGTTVYGSTEFSQAAGDIVSLSICTPKVTLGGATTIKVSVADTAGGAKIKAAATDNGAGNNASTIVGIKLA